MSTRTRIRRTAALLAALALAVPLAATAPGAATAAPPLPRDTEEVVDGVNVPWDVDFLPDGRMLVTERVGRIRIFESGVPGAARTGTVTVPDMDPNGEGGLMGLAVDVDFAENRHVYVCATRSYPGSGGAVNEVLRYTVGSQRWSAPRVILGDMAAVGSHNGCAVQMDESGLLWVSMGDARDLAAPQDRHSLNGKILRVTRDGEVPTDARGNPLNPVIEDENGVGSVDQVYTMGHRNPQGIAFEPGTGRVYSVEHGPSNDDEVNLLVPGANYGWPCVTGEDNDPYRPDVDGCTEEGADLDPDDFVAAAWGSGPTTVGTSGGSFARGDQWGDWEGDLFVSALAVDKGETVLRFDVGADGSLGDPQRLWSQEHDRLRGSVPGPGGSLYLTTSNGPDQVLRVAPSRPTVSRVAGADRYEVAAAVSADAHPSGADEVIVATGARFPDALAGSALGGREDAPVLLTRPGELPDSTRTELERLSPERITVLGGSASVSDEVLEELRDLAGTVERVGGADRYTVAARIANRRYERGVDAVFIASGETFPDALAAGPAAAVNGAPLLLVRRNSLPPVTAETLRVLQPKRIYVLGGTATISNATSNAIRPFAGAPRTRLSGPDRYAVAREVAREFWETSDVAIASGQTFPDGLTLGAAAGAQGEPLLLSRSGGVPRSTGQQVIRLAADDVTMAGGTASLGPEVVTDLRRLVGLP
ncbi:PQQ-dependent sugar dehydrogenase [Phycicoccus sp. BSK3Z-2]|uniref:PQQ-dependent sugar dehydrogenase n=1 Tax=Phycicoccus avicenniae TaxID=2828860 RepID=A0A941D7N5_9MICO|nr:PQQ-dependent sugar dehydrogenase [Phycicoccus avicenniae]MBR7743278.1 PQQ-dependent sugar dehydrogenase [Phycicoccus avicenniae]